MFIQRVCKHAYTVSHMQMHKCAHMHAHTRTRTHTHAHARTHTHAHTHTRTHTHTHTHTCTHTCTHTHTHTMSISQGAGTAIGELPPYFMARAARLSGQEDEEFEELEEELHSRVRLCVSPSIHALPSRLTSVLSTRLHKPSDTPTSYPRFPTGSTSQCKEMYA